MLRIGIIGAENSHCRKVAALCNVDKKVPARVEMVWGEKREFAEASAEAGAIPRIVDDWRDMLGQVDGVMIDHRHAKDHAEPALFFVGKGVPCFVDKPFTWTLAEGLKLCRLARKKSVPLTGFSVVALQKRFVAFKKKVEQAGPIHTLNTAGWADLNGNYGGVAFYGFHQVDTIIELCGTAVESVSLRRHGRDGFGLATISYANGPMVTMHCLNNGIRIFHWTAVCDKAFVASDFAYDANPYIAGTRVFTRMFRTGEEPFAYERMLAPIAVLEALRASLEQGSKTVKVKKIKI